MYVAAWWRRFAVCGGDDVAVPGEIAQLSCADDEFEAVFVTRAGVERRVPWECLPEMVEELERPVRSFPSYRGQRNYPGLARWTV